MLKLIKLKIIIINLYITTIIIIYKCLYFFLLLKTNLRTSNANNIIYTIIV